MGHKYACNGHQIDQHTARLSSFKASEHNTTTLVGFPKMILTSYTFQGLA